MKWLLDKPDTVVSVAEAHYDQLAGAYNFTDPNLLRTMFHEKVLHKSMYRNLGGVMPEVWDELQSAISTHFGTEPGASKTITLWPEFMDIIARASNRMFVGLPLCRNEAYLKDMIGFAESVIRCMTLLTFIPSLLHPVFGRLLSIPNNRHYARVKHLTIPVIKQRLADILEKKDVTNDYMTWHIKLAVAEKNEDELQPDKIARRLMPINFAAIHTTTMALTNIVLDIASADPSVLASLREEAERVYAACDGVWDKTAINNMIRTDSAIRESLRFSNFAARGIFRKIIQKDGLKNEAEGWIAPEGAFVSIDAHGVHHDESVYPNARVYDAFRFSREREAMEQAEAAAGGVKGTEEEKDWKERLRMKSAGLITTSDTFLPFGHGRHAWSVFALLSNLLSSWTILLMCR
jgi:cytochrome P450